MSVAETRDPAGPGAEQEQIAPWQEPARGGYPPLEGFGLAGIEQTQASIDGYIPPPPLAYLSGIFLTGCGPGESTSVTTVSPWMVSSQGMVSIGPLSILADVALGCAVQTTLPPATPYVTSELSLRVLAPPRAGDSLAAQGRIIHVGPSLGLSEVVVRDQQERTIAHGTSLCAILPALDLQHPALPDEPYVEPDHGSPHPYERPVTMGAPLDEAEWERRSGLEVLQAQLADELPAPPVDYLFGMRLIDVSEGAATYALRAVEPLTTPLRTLQGGVTGTLADAAISAAIQTTLPAGTRYTTVDLKVNYLRPAVPDGRELSCSADVIHRGRTIGLASAKVTNEDGKTVAIATGSAILAAEAADAPE